MCTYVQKCFSGQFIKKDYYVIISKIVLKGTQNGENAYLTMKTPRVSWALRQTLAN